MPTLTIEKAERKGEWQSNYGPMVTWLVTGQMDGETRSFEINRKPDSPAPSGTVEGEIQPAINPAYPPKFKMAPKANGFGGKSSGGDFRSPAQIMRGDAHGKALHWCDIKVAAGTFNPLSWDEYLKLVDAFYEDLKAAS